jgi:hypothetical protein
VVRGIGLILDACRQKGLFIQPLQQQAQQVYTPRASSTYSSTSRCGGFSFAGQPFTAAWKFICPPPPAHLIHPTSLPAAANTQHMSSP